MHFTNETLHPEAEDLTALLIKAAGQDPEERCYEVIQGLVGGTRIDGVTEGFRFRSEEACADLYATITEGVSFGASKTDVVTAVSRCLWLNQQRYPHG